MINLSHTLRHRHPHAVACIIGGSRAPASGRHVKQLFHRASATWPQHEASRGHATPEADITFDFKDHPKTKVAAGALPMLCTPTISNAAVTKTLSDGSAGLNVLSVETFDLLQVHYDQLAPTKPFSGVVKGSATPLGQVRLPVTFGKRNNYRVELIDFDNAASAFRTTPSWGIQPSPNSWRRPCRLQRHQDARQQRHHHDDRRHKGYSPGPQARLQGRGGLVPRRLWRPRPQRKSSCSLKTGPRRSRCLSTTGARAPPSP